MELTRDALEFMNIGRRYWDSSLKNLVPEQLPPKLKSYLNDLEHNLNSGIGITLYGKNSVGKSYILASLCKDVWQRFRYELVPMASYYITASELRDAWMRDKEAHPGSSETVLERVRRVPFLVVDDLGKEYRSNSGFVEMNFSNLLRNRSRQLLVTSFSLNMVAKEFSDVYGESFVHLLKECSVGIKIEGPDMRDKLRKLKQR